MQSVSVRFYVLKQLKGSRSLAVLATLAHGNRKLFPWDMCMYSFPQQVCFTLLKNSLCFLQLDWDNIYLERGGEERETKVASIIQTQMITFSWWIETEEYGKVFFGENISKLSFSSEIPFITDTSGGSYEVAGINTVRHLHKGHFLDLMGPKSPSVPTLQITSKVFGSIP